MIEAFNELNWLAVAIATFAYFMLGALWFTPLFGKRYDKAISIDRSKKQKWPMIYYIGPLIGNFVVALSIALLMSALGAQTIVDTLLLGFTVGAGLMASVSFTNAITPNMPRPLLFGAVVGGYHLVGAVIVSLVILYV